jgi:DNA polymerase elongation subunit (family B)
MSKIDLPPKEINIKFNDTPTERGMIAEYCSMDCELVLELMTKLCALQNVMEMSKVTLTPVQDIVSRGQQIKVLNQIIWYAHRDNFVVNDHEDVEVEQDGYEGARVLDPDPGFHAEPITVLDFSSLYPSIMRTHNLCFSTWVKNPSYEELPNAKYEHVNTGPRKYTFVQHIPGILPKILATLLGARKAVKKEMEAEKDPFCKSLLDAKQLALKVSANSVYGFCGTGKKGKYPCLPVSDSTTYFGRVMITNLKDTIEDRYPGSKVIYGDSVPGYTPVLIRRKQLYMDIVSIESLAIFQDNKHGEKQSVELCDIEVWSDAGWTSIVRIIRHKTHKAIYRISTATGIVDVTEDHSLLDQTGQPCRPADIKPGQSLLHSRLPVKYYPHEARTSDFIDQVEAARRFHAISSVLDISSGFYAVVKERKYLTNSFYDIASERVQNPHTVISIQKLRQNTDEYVYDLTTENHHFHAGVGQLIVHNTDSVMVKFPLSLDHPSPIVECFRMGNEVAKLAHEMFGGVIELAMEKVFHGYILLKKKRYAGLTYTDPFKPPKIKMSGVEAVRRDSSLMVSETYEKVVNALLKDRSVEKAVQVIKNKLNDLVENKIPFQEYVLSCQLKKEYKNPNQAQQVVVNKIRSRAPGSEPKSGDRVQYVIIEIKERNTPVYKKVEDAVYAQENKVPLDRLHYLENQLERPLTDLLEAFVKDPKRMFDEPRAKIINQREKLQDIRMFMKARPASETTTTLHSTTTRPTESVTRESRDLDSNRRRRIGNKQFDPRQPTLKRPKQ